MSRGGALHTGASVEWYTPPDIFYALGLDFDLDPCAPRDGAEWIPAAQRFSIEDDGLAQSWGGRVWLNPPYGAETAKWLGRLVEHGDGIALVFARTDTKWGQVALEKADAVCFVAGRLQFIDGSGRTGRPGRNAAAASMLLAYGPESAQAVLTCNLGVAFPSPNPVPSP